MQKVQPLMQEIQKKFADDPVRQNEEMQKLYAETKFNPLAGCVPMLIQMPIFLAMFQTLREIGYSHPDEVYSFYGIVTDLTKTPANVISDGFGAFFPYLVLMLVFALATFLPMVLQNIKNDSAQRNQMLIMGGVMTIFMLWISWSSPAGVLLFWGASSVIGILQQQLTMRHLKRVEAQAEAARIEVEPVKVDVERKAKKKRPAKSTNIDPTMPRAISGALAYTERIEPCPTKSWTIRLMRKRSKIPPKTSSKAMSRTAKNTM